MCIVLQAVQPKLEAMEAAWFRLHSISGAATPDQVIAYWEGMPPATYPKAPGVYLLCTSTRCAARHISIAPAQGG